MASEQRRRPGKETSRLLSTEVIRWSEASDWLLIPQQERSRQTLRKILEASIDLFARLGYPQTTIAAISKASGVSTGTIYGRFEDKQAILNAVMDAYYRSRRAQFDAVFSVESCREYDLRELVTFYTDLIFASFEQDSDLIQLADAERPSNERIASQVNDLNRHVATRFGDVLLHHAESIRLRDIATAAMLYHDLISCLARVSIQPTGPVASPFSITNAATERQLVEMFLHHLQAPESDTPKVGRRRPASAILREVAAARQESE
jgi:AcrR family transcriptional regulator